MLSTPFHTNWKRRRKSATR